MNLAGMIEAYRVAASDRVAPYFVEDADLTAFFNEAVRQACIRARLIHESADPDICAIPVVSGQAAFPLHPSVYELDHLAFLADGETRFAPVRLVSQEWLSANLDDWRDMSGAPEYAIQSDTALRLIPRPDRDGALRAALADDIPVEVRHDLSRRQPIGSLFDRRHSPIASTEMTLSV